MNQNLSTLQESYIAGLRQMTGGGEKKVAVDSTQRAGLGNRPKQQTGKEYAYYNRRDVMKQAFDISNKALIASFIFWFFLMYLIYNLGGYALMALRVMWDEADLRETCAVKFHTDPQENLQVIFNYPSGEAAPYLARFASEKSEITDYPMESDKMPPIVTAVRSSQFYQLQGLIKNLHELKAEIPDIKLIVYDLGLYSREKEILKQYCSCEVRVVDAGMYPDHVYDLSNFAWRPLVIQLLLEEHGAVIYLDVTTRFKSGSSLKFLCSRRSSDFLVWDTGSFLSTTGYTSKLTFHFFNETRCLFSDAGMIDSQLLVFYRTNATWHQVMKPWLKCALNADCITPRAARWDSCLHFRRPKTTGCHRYDLSALAIILNRRQQMTLADGATKHIPPRVSHTSEEEVTLFLEQPWTNTQLLILMGIPFLFMALIFRKALHRFLMSTIVKEY